jgi:two-component system, NtrC family, sensor kinase
MPNTLDRLRRYRLQQFLAIVVFVCIALPAVLSGATFIWQNYQRTLEHDSLLAANSYIDLLQGGMSVPLWNVSPELGRPLVETILVDPAVLLVRVKTEAGEQFLESMRESDQAMNAHQIHLRRDVFYNKQRIGEVELGYSRVAAQARAAHETQLLAIIILVQLVVSLVTISWLLHRRVLSPLRQLGAAAAGIAAGDLKTHIPALDKDEFGDLSQQLERMRGALDSSFSGLEKRVDERTRELRTVNRTLIGTLEQLQQTQHHLVQSEKLAALGALVAGVAHELNTPIGNGLTVATSLCESCDDMKQQMTQGLTRTALEKFMRDMDEGSQLVSRNLEKASELVSSFKQVAMDRTSAQRRKFSLAALLSETRLTLSPAFKRTPFMVEIEATDECWMDSYPGPLGQVITNLLNNTLVHAFEGRSGGRVGMTVHKKLDTVEIVVEDDGVGIPEENISRIFDPFFTTKLGAGGNGLGMHIVHNIVTRILGGDIHLHSEIGKGTRFTLVLPLVAPDSDQDEEMQERSPALLQAAG